MGAVGPHYPTSSLFLKTSRQGPPSEWVWGEGTPPAPTPDHGLVVGLGVEGTKPLEPGSKLCILSVL